MRLLVVFCHPDPDSFGAALRDAALRGLATAGHEVRLIDLYAEGFDPVFTCDEKQTYLTDTSKNIDRVAPHVEALRWAEGWVVVYPTWFYGAPAMLKGWLDRVWIPHATFTMPEGGKPIGRVLTNIRFVGAVSTLGSPWWWWRLVMSEPGRRTLLRGLRPLVNPRCRTLWLALHRMDSASADQRQGFLDQVERRLATIR